jgi:hypothetical protein
MVGNVLRALWAERNGPHQQWVSPVALRGAVNRDHDVTESLRAIRAQSPARIREKGPHMKRSQGLGEAKFSNAPKARTPTTIQAARRRSGLAGSVARRPARPHHHHRREDPYGGNKDAHDAQIGGQLPFMSSAQSGAAEGGSQRQTELEGHDDQQPPIAATSVALSRFPMVVSLSALMRRA